MSPVSPWGTRAGWSQGPGQDFRRPPCLAHQETHPVSVWQLLATAATPSSSPKTAWKTTASSWRRAVSRSTHFPAAALLLAPRPRPLQPAPTAHSTTSLKKPTLLCRHHSAPSPGSQEAGAAPRGLCPLARGEKGPLTAPSLRREDGLRALLEVPPGMGCATTEAAGFSSGLALFQGQGRGEGGPEACPHLSRAPAARG